MRGRKFGPRNFSALSPSTLRLPPVMTVGNCTVEVEDCRFTCEHKIDECLRISTMGPAKIRVSAVGSSSLNKNFSVVMLNPNDKSERSQTFIQEILSIYRKELPNMKYAANTRKKSGFIEKSVSGGKYQTLALTTISSEGHSMVIAALSFQIIASNGLYSEIPLAAVSSEFQKKGLGRLLYLELRRRLNSVGVLTVFCWGDDESKEFWVKQGFTSVGDVDGKGKARRLPIPSSIRKALCFPGDSTLMVSHLSSNPFQPGADGFTESKKIIFGECDLVIPESIPEEGEKMSDSSPNEGKKRCLWESSLTSLKSKRIRGSHRTELGLSSDCGYAFKHDLLDAHDGKCLSDELVNDAEAMQFQERARNDFPCDGSQDGKKPRIFLMNISDESKKILLKTIVEELGGSVASNGRFCTHVITGKALRTLNFCSALCSGAWIVSSNWLKQSHREKRFLDEVSFILEDEDYSLKYKSTVKDAVMKARANPGSMLKGYSIYLGKHVQPPPKVLSIIISSAGGTVVHGIMGVSEPCKTIFIACEEDMEEALLAAKKGIWTFNSDWLMSCIMRQELDFEAPQFSEPL